MSPNEQSCRGDGDNDQARNVLVDCDNLVNEAEDSTKDQTQPDGLGAIFLSIF
jgi:hypothetical protein